MGNAQVWSLKVLLCALGLGLFIQLSFSCPCAGVSVPWANHSYMRWPRHLKGQRTGTSPSLRNKQMFPSKANVKSSVCFPKIPQSNILVCFSCQEQGLLKTIVFLLFVPFSFYLWCPSLSLVAPLPPVSPISSHHPGGGPGLGPCKKLPPLVPAWMLSLWPDLRPADVSL